MEKHIMKVFVWSLIYGLTLLLFSCNDTTSVEPPNNQPKYNFSSVDKFIEDNAGLYRNQIAALVWQNGQIIYKKEINMGTDTPKVIASASKWLSAAVIMSLVDEHRLSLNDTVGKFLPIFTQYHKGGITIRQLFSHTSGLPGDFTGDTRGYEFRKDMTLAEAVDSIAVYTNLIHSPGTTFNYGECSMQIAGRIAEIVSGESWQTLFDEKIGTPCEMHASYVLMSAQNPMIGGGVRTTADDYMNFLEMIVNKGMFNNHRVLSENAVAEMLQVQTAGTVIEGTPYATNPYSPTPDAPVRYGIGNWCDVVDSSGNVVENSSPGAFGTHPWVDLHQHVAGIIFTLTRRKISTAASLQIRQMIRNIIDNSTR